MQNPSGLTHNLNKDSSIFSRGQDPLGRLIRQEEQNQKDKVQSEIIVRNHPNSGSVDDSGCASVVKQEEKNQKIESVCASVVKQEEQNSQIEAQSEIIVRNHPNSGSVDNPSFASVVSQNAFSSFPPTYPLMPTPLPSQPALIKDTFNLDEFTRKIKKQRREIPTIPISASNTPIGIPSDAKQSLR